MNSFSRFLILICMLSFMAMASFVIQPGHNWGDDFALYISQAIQIVDGFKFQELYEWNKVSMDYFTLGPYLYPMGFPLILSPVYWLFGLDFIALKFWCSLFFAFFIPISYLYFKKKFENNTLALLLVLIISFNFNFIGFSDNVLSDFPFLFFNMIALYFLDLQKSKSNLLIIGILIFVAYFIRDVGILLFFPLIAHQFLQIFRTKSMNIELLIPYVTFFALFFINMYFFPFGGQNHYDILISKISWNSISKNTEEYLLAISYFFFLKFEQDHGWFVVIITILTSAICFKRYPTIVVYFYVNAALLLIWPFYQGTRLMFPLFPFFCFFILKGIHIFFQRKFRIQIVFQFFIFAYVVWISHRSIYATIERNRTPSNAANSLEMQNVYSYLKANIPKGSVVAFEKPRALTLFTGVKSIYADTSNINETPASYFLLTKGIEATLNHTNLYMVKEFPNYRLFRKEPE